MKTKEELKALKEEVETVNKKLAELSDEELKEVTGGTAPALPAWVLDTSGMFNGCAGLDSTSDLPATSVVASDGQ